MDTTVKIYHHSKINNIDSYFVSLSGTSIYMTVPGGVWMQILFWPSTDINVSATNTS